MCQDHPEHTISRRGLFAGGLAMTVAGAAAATQATGQSAGPAPTSPEEALQRLMDGNARYVANEAINTDHSVGRNARAEGQQPFAAIVSCADSRVAPELIFDQGPGDLFVVRVAGNFINEDGLASLEFGAAVLGVQVIVVLGHTSCGAVSATIQSIQDKELPPGHLPSLVNALRPAVYDVMATGADNLLEAATAKNAVLNAEMASKAEPILAGMHEEGKLSSVAAVYDIATGKVEFL
ncbi:carbonic anhydrase [Chachezhania antarctica]|uniref:carbonic anhydrase n=1 Tax=Chachezhania antarctica TaxID=2340860 RepID=UPI000EB482D8|nr:carbonic anhydrase [Chachezhania antarctica]|tara:strand:+ start:15797 stop:16507 length:711 start_codon:yes stop_codon:yes gene_type:complete